jgi:thioredoxin-like negative regulator of GroEL
MSAKTNIDQIVIARSHERPTVLAFVSSAVPLRGWLDGVLGRVIRERRGRVALAVVDVDRGRTLAAGFGVAMVPTVKGFRGGRAVSGFISARPYEAVAAFVDSLLTPSDAERLREQLRSERTWPDVVAALDECDFKRAFELLIARAERGDARERERVRRLMVSLFAELGDGHPLSARYRRRLAAALY